MHLGSRPVAEDVRLGVSIAQGPTRISRNSYLEFQSVSYQIVFLTPIELDDREYSCTLTVLGISN